MGRRSSIHRLPAEIKDYIEAVLATGALTLKEIIDDLRARFPVDAAEGNLPSRSALQRYGSKISRRIATIKASTEAARLISEQAGDSQDARSEALTALVQSQLFDAILSLQEATEPGVDQAKRIEMLGTTAKNIASLTRSSVNLKKFQAQVEADTRRKLREEQGIKLAEFGAKRVISEDTIAAIRKAVLGIV
ncbi:DUF3486 family protein [Variovorax sp. RKNM96]|uniref:DUF3486 family protein n=1 Tax=Variovorax sp. RKNM96 TaxID=2681552 RepID=UPI00197F5422|nr:DUF3486 family protein [Variovorax sp. RKNM96]QSI33319.1 DUF3486 family protein [Variovorax sp. RKNM96]